ncbi:MAG: tyrosine-type recombinase/integrase, partial [Paenibacillus macerans]|nr:tyrosine-type recombinase/integrase [Paenibacillus macerans]
ANKALATALKNLNIENIISVHGCRHTHASILLYKRRSIYYVSERLGHEDIQTTLETYAHILKELREQDDKGTIKTFEAMYA